MSVCDSCPLMSALDAADEMISELGSAHRTPEHAHAGIGIQRRALELLAARHQCSGPRVSTGGQDTCPSTDWTQYIYNAAAKPWAEIASIDLDALSGTAKVAPARSLGAML